MMYEEGDVVSIGPPGDVFGIIVKVHKYKPLAGYHHSRYDILNGSRMILKVPHSQVSKLRMDHPHYQLITSKKMQQT